MANDTRKLLLEGLSDAVGFVGGALFGFWLARLFGFDIFAAGYSNSTIVGILMVGIGGGLGLQIARRWRRAQEKKRSEDA
ncbi:hypothetical protein [Polaromonas sp. A23]|uniref:hypothetical protein n=1 Tax=Polaromonas sp. A23 TaxID=1944133 RepID=UPI0009849B67|nr:hypothetical protein [Polaromonas sp. A23]OOG40997.1 hypothetical protein B0B52_11625 [Polaromonas sp. A23]